MTTQKRKQITRKTVKCKNPSCEVQIRYDKRRGGYCVIHTDWTKTKERITRYNKESKTKPEHLKYRTEQIHSIPRCCLVCKRDFLATPAAVRRGGGNVCSRKCQGIRAAKITPKRDTSIEKAIENSIIQRGWVYEKQVPLHGITLADFYLPEYKAVLFCDGEYWHSFEKRKIQDNEQNRLLKLKGYKVFRFSEKEIKMSPDKCLDEVSNSSIALFRQSKLPIF